MKKTYEFSGLSRLWSGLVMVLFLGFWLISIPFFLRQFDGDAPFIFVMTTVSCWVFILLALYWYVISSGKLVLTDQTVTLERFNKQTIIAYKDILEVRKAPLFLTIVTNTRQLKINRQIEDYIGLYTLLRKQVAVLSDINHQQLPLVIKGRISDFIGGIFLVAVVFVFPVMIAIDPTRHVESLSVALIIIVMFTLFGTAGAYVFILKRPLEYKFMPTYIEVNRLLGRQRFEANLVQSIKLDKNTITDSGFDRYVYFISISFTDGDKLKIEQNELNYPFETLFEILKRSY